MVEGGGGKCPSCPLRSTTATYVCLYAYLPVCLSVSPCLSHSLISPHYIVPLLKRPLLFAMFTSFTEDLQQVQAGSCQQSDIAARVMTRVIAQYPDRGQLAVDSGFTAISKQHGDETIGYGLFDEHPELKWVRVLCVNTCQFFVTWLVRWAKVPKEESTSWTDMNLNKLGKNCLELLARFVWPEWLQNVFLWCLIWRLTVLNFEGRENCYLYTQADSEWRSNYKEPSFWWFLSVTK